MSSGLRIDITTPSGTYERFGEIQLVDCRERFEWEAGRIEGAIHVTLDSIMAGATGELDPEKPVAVICRTGSRSELAALMLRARGFEAYSVEGGMHEWQRRGHPFTTPDGAPGRVA
jgi:rhodanese-related sulfurtransferase